MSFTRPPSGLPQWQSNLGALWLDESLSGEPLLIREVPGAPGLLKLGVAIRHASRANHPRLRTPKHWWRAENLTYLGFSCPAGIPLACWESEKLSFHEALLAITPLALALKEAHRKGIVHGKLTPWTLFFDPQRLELTALELGTRSFQGDQSVTTSPQDDLTLLARILLYLTLPDQEWHQTRPNFQGLPGYAIPILSRCIEAEERGKPSTVEEFLAGLAMMNPGTSTGAHTEKSGDQGEEKNEYLGRVQGLELFEHPRRGPGLRFRLFIPSFEDRSSQGLPFFLYQEQDPISFKSLLTLWEGAEIRLLSPRTIVDSQGRRFLTGDAETLYVIEPHWPVAVSDVLKAQGCPSRMLVDLRDPGAISYHLPFGNLIHQFFEDLIAEEDLGFEEALKERLPPLYLDFLASGVEDEQLQGLITKAKDHFENLRRFAARRTRSGDLEDRVGWCGNHTETTRYSARYGLEGRTDLVVTDKTEGLQIIELKSGKAWHDHPGQVQSYALLWEEVAKAMDMKPTGFLLYSQSGRMSPVPLDRDSDQSALLGARNSLLGLYHSFIDETHDYRPPHFMEVPEACRKGACRFRKDRCKAQTELLNLHDRGEPGEVWKNWPQELVTTAMAYHRHFSSLVEMERWEDHLQLGAISNQARLPQRLLEGTAATDLSIIPMPRRRQILLRGENLHIFSGGDRLLLHRGEIDRSQIFRARIIEDQPGDLSSGELLVTLSTGTITGDENLSSWTADLLPARIGYRTAHRSLFHIIKAQDPALLEVLLRPENYQQSQENLPVSRPSLHQVTTEALNDSQLDALIEGLSDKRATLIQGPPGTGKTTVISHLALELIDRDQTLLLSALTNTAVDTMLIKLLRAAAARGQRYLPFLRLGSASSSPMLSDALEGMGFRREDYFSEDLARNAGSLRDLGRRLDQVQVFASTAHSSLEHSVIQYLENSREIPFDVALIDEASQLTEPMALAPLSKAKRFVLVGDHRQLPPIVSSERALSNFLDARKTIAAGLECCGVRGLDQSLFERLARFLAPRMLTTQYRMNEAIMAFPAATYYESRLKAHPEVAKRTLPVIPSGPGPLQVEDPLIFVDMPSGVEVGRANEVEARALLKTAQYFIDHHRDCSLGVIAPFRSQVHLLRRLFREAHMPKSIAIDTVERFQGNERDCILVSLVKTERPGDFLADERRFNVTLTRARKKLILFGHRECLQQDPTFRQWLEHPSTTQQQWLFDDI